MIGKLHDYALIVAAETYERVSERLNDKAEGMRAAIRVLGATRESIRREQRQRAYVSPALLAVIEDVAARNGVAVSRLVGNGRFQRELMAYRDEAAWLMRQQTPTPSYPTIAEALRMSDHTLARDAVRRFDKGRRLLRVSTVSTAHNTNCTVTSLLPAMDNSGTVADVVSSDAMKGAA